jgi:hypothetical protein
MASVDRKRAAVLQFGYPRRVHLALRCTHSSRNWGRKYELQDPRRMVSSGILRRVALLRTDVSEELIASFNRVKIKGVLGTTLTLTSNLCTLRRNGGAKFLRNVGTYKSHTS